MLQCESTFYRQFFKHFSYLLWRSVFSHTMGVVFIFECFWYLSLSNKSFSFIGYKHKKKQQIFLSLVHYFFFSLLGLLNFYSAASAMRHIILLIRFLAKSKLKYFPDCLISFSFFLLKKPMYLHYSKVLYYANFTLPMFSNSNMCFKVHPLLLFLAPSFRECIIKHAVL